MNERQEHSALILEFDKIRVMVASYARSLEGARRLGSEWPCATQADFKDLRSRVEALHALLEGDKVPPMPNLEELGPALAKLFKEGLYLELEELSALGQWCRATAQLRRFFLHEGPALSCPAFWLEYPELGAAEAIIDSVVGPDGQLRDLPELREISRRQAKLRQEIQALIASYCQDEHVKSMLQSDVPTQRDGRTVLAVKANYRGRIKGIVHEASASGQTVYLEPDRLVERNNELVREEGRYRQELFRILRERSDQLRPHAQEIAHAHSLLVEFDAIYSRALYGHKNSYSLVATGPLKLFQARHPLLGSRAVPIEIVLGEDTRVLIISGPNTGGKTVGLKTVGLLSLMNQFGLALPCAPHSSLPFYTGVYADIGDEQSISQSLSTFSAHMRNISLILGLIDGDSLVLLDELGSGTDPEEGSALALALLDELLGRGSMVILTSHHGILKNYGYSRLGCQNASVEFDGNTLGPTYRILLGIPGESHALDIAQKTGLDRLIVDRARGYLREERADVSKLIQGLREKHQQMEELERRQRLSLREAVEGKRQSDLKELRLKQKELELRTQGAAELRRLLGQSRSELENLVRQLREGELTKEKTLAVKAFISGMEERSRQEDEKLRALEAEMAAEEARDETAEPLFCEGAEVLYGPKRMRARLLRMAKGGRWEIALGDLRLVAQESQLEVCKGERAPAGRPEIHIERLEGPRAKLEIDVRGMRLLEAIKALDEQIDAAVLAGFSSFGLIHGMGEGVLQKGLHEHLKQDRRIRDYHFSRPEEGGFGRTFVSLG